MGIEQIFTNIKSKQRIINNFILFLVIVILTTLSIFIPMVFADIEKDNFSSEIVILKSSETITKNKNFNEVKLQTNQLTQFVYNPQVDLSFNDINGQSNGSIISDATPVFNWSKVTNAHRYQLQIANDSEFTDVFVNLINISSVIYPDEYSEGSDYVLFTLPDDNKIPSIGIYYCRVRGYERG